MAGPNGDRRLIVWAKSADFKEMNSAIPRPSSRKNCWLGQAFSFLYLLSVSPALAQYQFAANAEPIAGDGRVGEEHYRLVKRLDFNERPLGNYENCPMNWRKLSGPGLPSYSRGIFDDGQGAAAPPSFHLMLETGNVGYEYAAADLVVIPQSDYLVAAKIRPDTLRNAAAFVAAYLVDRYGEQIAGSARISRMIRSVSSEAGHQPQNESWQSVDLTLPGEFPDAHALRLQLWILQDATWRAADARAIDPILRTDVRVGAWFDDLAVYRLPRARLTFSNPAGLVLPGRRESLLLDINNATAHSLAAWIRVVDRENREVYRTQIDIPSSDTEAGRVAAARVERGPQSEPKNLGSDHGAPHAPPPMRQLSVPLPDLPVGIYRVFLSVFSGEESLLERRIRFAILPPLPGECKPHPDIGLDLGPWRGGDWPGVAEAVSQLSAGHIKVGVPLAPDPPQEEITRLLNGVSGLVREMAKRRVDTTGVLMPRVSPGADPMAWSLHEALRQPEGMAQLSPTFAHFGGMMPSWQVGTEPLELSRPGIWTEAMLSQALEHLRRFVTSPELVAPVSVFSNDALVAPVRSVWLPNSLPARNIPRQIEPFVCSGARTWIRLESPPAQELGSAANRESEMARRIALAKAGGGDQLVVDAPFRQVGFDGNGFEPTDEFLVLRTMLRFLGDKRLSGALRPAPEVLALIFSSPAETVMVIWSWRDSDTTRVEMYLGQSARLFGIDGLPRTLEKSGSRSVLYVGAVPQIVLNLASPQALLQASFEVSPRNVQLHDPEPRPVLRFRNPYSERIAGDVYIQPPERWQIAQSVLHFDLEPGEELRQPLVFTLPPQQVATLQAINVRVHIRSPEDASLEFQEQLTVGLHDIRVVATPRWEGNTLVVEHAIVNETASPVSFSGHCNAPGRPRAEADFVEIRSGDSMKRTYVFRDADGMRGQRLHLGIQEIRGERRLNQLVDIPQR